MKRSLFSVVLAVVCIAAGYWLGHRGAGGHEEAEPEAEGEKVKPVAMVETVPLEKLSISETDTAYGTVVAQPGEVQSVSVEYESRVVRLLIASGQQVEKDQALIEIEPSPDAKLQFNEATAENESSQQELAQVERSFAMKLAVNSDLQTAKRAAQSAQTKLKSLQSRGLAGRQKLKAEVSGVAGKISVQAGQIVAAGSSLLEIVPAKQIEVRLGVEAEDVGRLEVGQGVKLSAVHKSSTGSIDGKIRLITRQVNATTRLIDIFVALPPESDLMLESYVRGEITIAAKEALVVPRAAVLPNEDKHVLFTVKDGHAVKHEVETGLENSTHVEVIGEGLEAGEQVVTTGNYELEDGMEVQTPRASAETQAPEK
ncbi:MAG: rane fusion protein multidrug efflux system [Chthoniobacter sp.]|nr:rane fusion protein multidrug efflux system [Chthoniobacter sp.]